MMERRLYPVLRLKNGAERIRKNGKGLKVKIGHQNHPIQFQNYGKKVVDQMVLEGKALTIIDHVITEDLLQQACGKQSQRATTTR